MRTQPPKPSDGSRELNDEYLISATLDSHRTQFDSIAQAWLREGAQAFSVWSKGDLLAQWPNEAQTNRPGVSVPIMLRQEVVGELRLTGSTGSLARERLIAEAQLVSRLVAMEEELESVTAALIDTQDQLLALYDLTRSTRLHLNMGETLLSITREAASVSKAAGAFALLSLSDEQFEQVQFPTPMLESQRLIELFQRVRTNDAELLLSAKDVPELLHQGVKNLFIVPITINESISAALGLTLQRPTNKLSPDLKLARAVADQAGARIENVLLHQETMAQERLKTELDLAADIQLRLLPQHLPQWEGVDLFARSRPASQVGGDFFDFVHQPGRPAIFILGDVSGKGISAALIMAMTRTVLRSKANYMPTPSPEVIMARTHEDLYQDLSEVGMFTSIFIGQYDAQTRELTYANAGQSPVIHRPANGRAALQLPDGTAIGVLPKSICENQSLTLQPGDLWIVASDGFSDARNPAGEMFGYERLLQLVDHLADQSARQIAETMFEAVDGFAAGHLQDDDETLVVIKVEKH